MREKDLILGEATSCVKTDFVHTPSCSRMNLLTLEALIDIRDQISTMTNVLISLRESVDRIPAKL